MAGPACKIVINMGIKALTEAIERILIDPDVHQERIPTTARLDLIQRLADIDLGVYAGDGIPQGGLSGILLELEKYHVVTPEVWEIYKRPQ